MSNKLPFKLKSSSTKRKISSPSSNPSTATNSQSSVGAQKHESSIDDPIVNEEIKSLRVTEEQLRELHPTIESVPFKEKETKIFIKEPPPTPPTDTGNIKNVVVLHPMPPKVKLTKTKILGSLKGGPRCDQDNVFVSHSIIGTFEEYTESRQADRNTATETVPSTVPPVVLPKVSKKKAKPGRTIVSQTNALMNWERQMNKRKLIQERIAKRLQGEKGSLTMNYGDTYRRVQEERSFIDRAIPAIDSGKGHFVGSEFWRLQSTVGDPVMGIRTTLTKTEKGDPPVSGFVSCPSSATERNNMFKTWSRSWYLWKRKEQLARAMSEPKYPVDLDTLQLTGLSQSPTLPLPPRPLGSSHSLDSLGESLLNEEEEEEEEEAARGSACSSLQESVSLLDTHPDVVAPPLVGPALQIQDQLYTWFGEEGEVGGATKTQLRVLFEIGIQELSMNQILLENVGTVAISFSWKRVPNIHKLGLGSSEQTQRFYFDTREGVILPGRSLSLGFIFKSPNPGIFAESWEVVTRPVLLSSDGRSPILLTLKGVSFQPDLYHEKRAEIERMLTHEVANATSKRLVDQMINSVHTPPRVVTPIPLIIPEEDEFLSKNPGVYYHYNAVQQLKVLYIELHNPPTQQEPTMSKTGGAGGGAGGGGGGGGKKQQETKKGGAGAGGGGGGGKKVNREESSKQIHTETTADQLIELNIPPWDLSLETLEKLILDIEDGSLREEKLKVLNSIVSDISSPLPAVPRSTNYIKTYFLLCEAIDMLVNTSERLRQVMGLPSKDSASSLQEDDSQSELEQPSQPSSPVIIPPQSSRKDQTKRGNKAAKETNPKEKEQQQQQQQQQRPTSKKGGTKPSKKGTKGSSKISKAPSIEMQETNAVPSKPSEIDPMITLKYKEIFQSVARDIMASTVDQISSLITEDLQ